MDVSEAPGEGTQTIPSEKEGLQPDILTLGTFVLPKPPPLSEAEIAELGTEAVERIFTVITSMPQSSKATKDAPQALGFGRLAASSSDRDSWLTLFTRLATRASAGLEYEDPVNGQTDARSSVTRNSMSNTIREMLYRYVLEDFRVRINVAISWMNEEWYNDQVQLRHAASQNINNSNSASIPHHYDHWAMRLLEGILPYLDSRDKILIRFLSELPEINSVLIQKVKTLANDPERVNLCVQALQYVSISLPLASSASLHNVLTKTF